MSDARQTLRAALFDRVSTAWQDEAAALPDLRAQAVRRGFAVVLEITETVTGGRGAKRPGLARLLSAASRGQIDVVLVRTLDRFGRSTLDLLANLRRLRDAGVRFVAVEQGIEVGPVADLAGDLVIAVLAATAEFTLHTIRRNTKEGLRRAKLRGAQLGRPRAPGGPDPAKVAELRAADPPVSWSEIGRRLKCPPSRARRAYAKREAP